MKIGIHSRTFEADKLVFFKSIINEIARRGFELSLYKDLSKFLKQKLGEIPPHHIFNNSKELQPSDLIFSVGGDGTLLETVLFVKEKNIPIIGVNTGRLGFLATISNDKIKEAMDSIFAGNYTIDSRTLIKLETNEDIFAGNNFGLNEFTILKRDTSSMIIVHTYIDGEYLNSYWADGLIIATPTGSTGYSLSVGGPVVVPQSNNFIISPVSPHNLNVRPLIVSDDCTISFEIEGRSKNFLISLDSRSRKVDESIKMAVRKSDFKANLLKLKGDNFLHTLRKKLHWGLDLRNRN
ncbi:MAG: NAD kinase [Flammeovirgaceae bacterium]|nr:NAD kinase [Flammeovirgaceae bacterium]